MPEKPNPRPRHTTEEDRIRAQYKTMRAISRGGWVSWQGANYHIWMPLARKWKRPIREIKRIVGKKI